MSRKEYFNLYNTLSCIPNILLNENVLILLRNDTWVAGKISSADGFMNICLENVVFCDQKNSQYKLDNYAVRYRQILYVEIPEKIKIKSALGEYMDKLHKPHAKKKRTFKEKRALVKTKQTAKENKM